MHKTFWQKGAKPCSAFIARLRKNSPDYRTACCRELRDFASCCLKSFSARRGVDGSGLRSVSRSPLRRPARSAGRTEGWQAEFRCALGCEMKGFKFSLVADEGGVKAGECCLRR